MEYERPDSHQNQKPNILFEDRNYQYKNPWYDFLVTRVLLIPLFSFSLVFCILNFYEFSQHSVFIPFVFQNILLLFCAFSILYYYPRRTLQITDTAILLFDNKDLAFRLDLADLTTLSIECSISQHSFLSYKKISFSDQHEKLFSFITPRTQDIQNILQNKIGHFTCDISPSVSL